MKNFLSRIWLPALLVSMAALQSFGIDAGRSAGLFRPADSLILDMREDSSSAITAIDSSFAEADTILAHNPDSAAIEIVLSARDTIKVPDSLRETDPFKYKYYIAVKDSVTRFQVLCLLF